MNGESMYTEEAGSPLFTPGPPPVGEDSGSDLLDDRKSPMAPICGAGFVPRSDLPTSTVRTLMAGRYRGGDGLRYTVELRIDGDNGGTLSGEIATAGTDSNNYLASFRTEPGIVASLSDEQWPVILEASDGGTSTGSLDLLRHSRLEDALFGTITLDQPLDGVLFKLPVTFSLRYHSRYLRSIGLEIETEIDVDGLPTVIFRGQPMNVTTAWEGAGMELYETGNSDMVPHPVTPWGTAQLHALMFDLAQSNLKSPDWALRLLWLSRPSRGGLMGVMFDNSGVLQRQGLAVFAEEVRALRPQDADRKLIQTTVHEMGHALNLTHRFERGVGRADSTSFMNYDWRYLGGQAERQFWQRFEYSFDQDELDFLRHGPRHAVIPGGAGFHQVHYWSQGNGGYSSYGREETKRVLELRLNPPVADNIFRFGQPVLLGLALRNVSQKTLELPGFVLDSKAGFIEFIVQRVNNARRRGSTEQFRSIMARSFDMGNTKKMRLRPGRTLKDNVNLTFGSSGFSFSEPGAYQVTAHLALDIEPRSDDRIDLFASSEPLMIHVAYPHSLQDEKDAVEMFSSDAGTYVALGGSQVLERTADTLAEVAERRLAGDCTDPIGTVIRRCQGIDAGRGYVRYESGRFSCKDGDASESARLLGTLSGEMLKAFDEVTIRDTRALTTKQVKRAEKK